jgi:hypothetical protein
MSLLESRLLGEFEACKFTRFNAIPENSAEVILQNFELHGRSIAPGLGHGGWRGRRFAVRILLDENKFYER